jgi:hypothetical protein
MASLLSQTTPQPKKTEPVYFGRFGRDGVPYRGQPQLFKEDEYDEKTQMVRDSHSKVFDITDPVQNEQHEVVLNKIANGLAELYRYDQQMVPQPDGNIKVFVFVVWMEPFREPIDPAQMPTNPWSGLR